MKIINPLYDNAFKYLMDNEQIAKKVLSIILGREILSLQSKPQETGTYTGRGSGTPRFDFKAVIGDGKGGYSSALIELQKYKSPNPISRFREYLADNYRKEETYIDAKGREITAPLPIITIYILGFMITKEQILVLHAERVLKDKIWGVEIKERPEFVELLTHDSLILQVTARPEKTKGTQLEKFVQLFVQKLKKEKENYVIDFEPDEETRADKDISSIVDYLGRATTEESILRSLKYEEAMEQGLKSSEQELAEMKAENEKERKDRLAAEEQAKAERKEREAAEEQAKAERKEREAAEEQAKAAEEQAKAAEEQAKAAEEQAKAADQKLIATAKRLATRGLSHEEIAEVTSLDVNEIRQILAGE